MSASPEVIQSLPKRKTKIVATLGPASFDKLRDLILAGVNVFRINFSHATISDEQIQLISNIRKMSDELNIPVGILGDLPGPKVRCGAMKDGQPILLEKGKTVLLRASDEPGEQGIITTPIRPVVHELEVGHFVLLDDGTKKLKVTKRNSLDELECIVEVGGLLKDKKGINVPDVKLGVSALTEIDKKLLTFILEQKLDFVAISFVQRAQDIIDAREHIAQYNASVAPECQWTPLLVAKIEKPQAVDDLDEILEVVDSVMVARGDLGVECSLERVPLYQKIIIHKANKWGRVVITATQMLETMMNVPMPTRAEVSDIANAIFDGTDAVMLSGESAAGKYPVESVAMMASICTTAEERHDLIRVVPIAPDRVQPFMFAVSEAAISCAQSASAKAIIAFTTTGFMARLVSKHKFFSPTIAITHSAQVLHQLTLLWGVYPILLELSSPNQSSDQLLSLSEQAILSRGWVKLGDPIVFTSGQHDVTTSLSLLTNSMQLSLFGQVTKSIQARSAWAGAVNQVLQNSRLNTSETRLPHQN